MINNQKQICSVQSGFMGHCNNAKTYRLMPNIGPGEQLNFANQYMLLTDKMYPNGHPLMTPFSTQEISLPSCKRQDWCYIGSK